MAIQLLINCMVMSYWHTVSASPLAIVVTHCRRFIPNVPTYISIDYEHQNGIINSSLVGVIIGDWKYYNYQGLCFNSKLSIRVGWNNHLRESLMNITVSWYPRIETSSDHLMPCRGFEPPLYSNLYRPNRLDQHGFLNLFCIII